MLHTVISQIVVACQTFVILVKACTILPNVYVKTDLLICWSNPFRSVGMLGQTLEQSLHLKWSNIVKTCIMYKVLYVLPIFIQSAFRFDKNVKLNRQQLQPSLISSISKIASATLSIDENLSCLRGSHVNYFAVRYVIPVHFFISLGLQLQLKSIASRAGI